MPASAHSITWLSGFMPDLPTPFDARGNIDAGAFATLCERQIEAGVAALVVGETTGEASILTSGEHRDLVRLAVDTARGRARIIAGAGSNSTHQAIEFTRQAEAAGADAILSVVPYCNRPMQDGISAHFQAIAASTALPIILHDIPARTARECSDTTILRLAESTQFAGLKDASGDLGRLMRLASHVRPGFRLLSGDDTTAWAYVAAGGHGCISMLSNIAPDLCAALHAAGAEGRLAAARDLSDRLRPMAQCVTSPSAVKYALSLLGPMDPATRLPMLELDEATQAEVAKALAGLKSPICRPGSTAPAETRQGVGSGRAASIRARAGAASRQR